MSLPKSYPPWTGNAFVIKHYIEIDGREKYPHIFLDARNRILPAFHGCLTHVSPM